MKRTTLPGTTLNTSALGLGSTGGRLSESQRIRLYEIAFENGITHFDTARAYGVGGAEGTLGKFLADKRDEVTIATKFGILPSPSTGRLFRSAKGVARSLERLLPSVGNRAKHLAAGKLLRGSRFSIDDARSSLETSLNELRTEYVDILLMHECSAPDVQPELLDFLSECSAAGKVRYTGTATSPVETRAILEQGREFPRIVQVANNVLEPTLSRLQLAGRASITHSPLSRALPQVRAALNSSPDLGRVWSDRLGADMSDPKVVSSLLLSWAVHANPNGIVLFYSSDERHIADNLGSLAGASAVDAERVATLSRLIETIRPSAPDGVGGVT